MTEPAREVPRSPAVVHNTISGHGPHTSIQAGAIDTLHVYAPRHEVPVPRQVRPVPAAYTDRVEERDRLMAWIAAQPDHVVPVILVHGPPGVGKTTFVERLVHGLADRYAGGQLQADLSSADGPARVSDVLGRLLRAVQPGPLPAGDDELAGWWRSATAARPPMCLLLDGVTHADQIRALTPGGAGHLVVATSRLPLPELVAQGAALLPLGPFDHDAARAYLSRCLGVGRLDREPEAVTRLVALSAGLPGALAVGIARLALNPSRPLSTVVGALEASQIRTGTGLAHNRPGAIVSAALDTAYADLPRPATRLYRKAALLPGDTIDAHLAAAITVRTPIEAGADLADLAASGLLLRDAAGHPVRGPVYRYTGTSLVHARVQAAREETDGADTEAQVRACDWYLATATAAERLLTPSHRPLARTYVYRPEHPVEFGGRQAALSWLDAQSADLMATVRAAYASGRFGAVWQLVHAMWPWWRSARVYGLWIEAHYLGLDAARLAGDPIAEQEIRNTLGVGLRGTRVFNEAIACFTDVLAAARDRKDTRAEGQALHELGATTHEAGRPEEAVGFLEQARALRERRQDRRGVALTDILLGQVHLTRGHVAAAVGVFVSARAALVEVADPHDAARALAWLGRAHSLAGDHEAAEQAGRQAHEEFVENGSRQWIAHSLEMLGQSMAAAGRGEDAITFYTRALEQYSGVSAVDTERVRRWLKGAR
ncbi:tetratricopeptide repeat protein [Streptomyces sp. NPDC048717]|uniref:tetratricopeptide repeat protein n=1 Tax=Streptomyces sp. NPDC048717 TaxID=3154928 RepID=UPI0034166A10